MSGASHSEDPQIGMSFVKFGNQGIVHREVTDVNSRSDI